MVNDEDVGDGINVENVPDIIDTETKAKKKKKKKKAKNS